MKFVSVHYNRPDFVEYQSKTLRRFLPGCQFVVFNNAKDDADRNAINEAGHLFADAIYDVKIPYPGLAGLSHQAALRWIVKHLFAGFGPTCIIDHDVFAYAPVTFGFAGVPVKWPLPHIASVPQAKGDVVYPWPGLLMLNLPELDKPETINLDGYHVNGEHVDSGGQMWHYINDRPWLNWYKMSTTSRIVQPSQGGMLPEDLRVSYDWGYGWEFIDDCFLHYSRGSNWALESDDLFRRKTDDCFAFLDRRVDG